MRDAHVRNLRLFRAFSMIRVPVRLPPAPLLSLMLSLVAAKAAPVPARGQEQPEVRVLTVVDYIAGNEIYLASGTDHGIREGDTLSVYDGEGEAAQLLGFLAIQSANERRSVAIFAGTQFPVQRADLLYLGLRKALADARALEAGGADVATVEEPTDPDRNPERTPKAEPRPPVRWQGRISLDMDALRTTTRWGEAATEEIKRSFSTPTIRLQARGRNLPGGMRLNTSMRLSHRSSPDDVVQPVTSMRFYQFDLEKRFESAPLQLHLGRFHNPFDDFSGYWDGLMVHLGEGGLGGGFAIGFEPDLWNESVTSELPKASGFLDYGVDGEAVEYSGALSFSATRPTNGLPDQTYLGLSQRIRAGRAWIRQRLRVDRTPDGSEWQLARLQVDVSLPLSDGLSARGGWRRWRISTAFFSPGSVAPLRDRATLGLSYWGFEGGGSVDVAIDRPEFGDPAQTVSSSFFLRRTPLLGLGFSGSASYWTRGDDRSFLLSPEVRREFGRTELRGAFRLYGTKGDFGEIRHQSADLALTVGLGRGLSARVQGFLQWGGDLTSNRLLASLWKSF